MNFVRIKLGMSPVNRLLTYNIIFKHGWRGESIMIVRWRQLVVHIQGKKLTNAYR